MAVANPAHVSRVLKAAGFRKAGRYTAFGYVDRDGNAAPGFAVEARKDFVEVPGRARRSYETVGAYVYFCQEFHPNTHAPEIVERAAEAIRAAGYTVTIKGRDRQSMDVTR